ncbi:hypothetical protein HYR54_05475 [Candidatus Acetothermia bacterium]|nr:hypothetical protein [Candidatus Acetothermia bacterium]
MKNLGISLLIIGVGSFILPMLGYQFRMIQGLSHLLGEHTQSLLGICAAVLGLILTVFGWKREQERR